MAVRVIVAFNAKPEKRKELQDFIIECLPATRQFSGCRDVQFYHASDDPNNFIVLEVWDSRAHFDKYVEWRVGTGFLDIINPMQANDFSITCYDEIEVKALATSL